ncbi:MAG: type II secretion system protein [Lentisphaeraceae bacterium]|nr:type II secretion system protein [Lentisphaeraceae bacterium]
MNEKRKFTLIELLVVIAIIGILASMLLPSLQHARGTAKTSVCLSNTKQIALAYVMYTDENKGYTIPRIFEEDQFWFSLILPYHGSDSVLNCTEVTGNNTGGWGTNRLNWGGTSNWLNTYGSYGLNGYSYSNEGSDSVFFRYMAEPEDTTRTPLFVDAAWVDTWPSFSNANPTALDGSEEGSLGRIYLDRHVGRKSNLSFFDGSARTIKITNFLQYDWRKDPSYRTIPSF